MAKVYSQPVRRRLRGKLTKCFYVRERDTLTGRRRWVNTHRANVQDAKKRKRTLERADDEGKADQVNLALGDAVAQWLATKKAKLTPKGYETYEDYGDSWLEFFPESAPVRSITSRQIERFFLGRASEVSGCTLNKIRMCLRQFFRWCQDHKLIDDSNVVTVGRFAQEEHDPRALSREEQAALLRACRKSYRVEAVGFRNAGGKDGGKKTKKARKWRQEKIPPSWLYPIVRVGLATGLRLGNLVGLLHSDVDLAQERIRIPARRMKAKRDFALPLDRETVEFLRRLRETSGSVRVFACPDRGAVRERPPRRGARRPA